MNVEATGLARSSRPTNAAEATCAHCARIVEIACFSDGFRPDTSALLARAACTEEAAPVVAAAGWSSAHAVDAIAQGRFAVACIEWRCKHDAAALPARQSGFAITA
jgi:hypothetical protein